MTQVSPQTAGDNLEKRTIGLPPQMWEEAENIGEDLGLRKAEAYRFIFAEGISVQKSKQIAALQVKSAEIDLENKALLNQKLKHRQQLTFEAISRLKAATTGEERAEALEQLEQCLTD